MAEWSSEQQSYLCLLRVWFAPGPNGAWHWRGKLQPVLGDRSYCFTSGAELLALLQTLFPPPSEPADAEQPGD